ncbi:hypothetical protein BMF94_2325 [Rhodotorula taiwanensis]|uniref:ER membrane protein complex subunit 6 n=1 Tax=Rhodotorula taiwanensis TaxID=741276 RepID=A0A2S5BCR4_9BASI|nr:hypothetical protein BMF94_2325 [Rhodotorula taiwanensis]
MTNSQALDHVKSTTACIAGALAGLLGLTSLNGFLLYLAVSLGVGALYSAVNCKGEPARYFLKPSEPVLNGTVGNCFPFILFWTLFYSLVYIYD